MTNSDDKLFAELMALAVGQGWDIAEVEGEGWVFYGPDARGDSRGAELPYRGPITQPSLRRFRWSLEAAGLLFQADSDRPSR